MPKKIANPMDPKPKKKAKDPSAKSKQVSLKKRLAYLKDWKKRQHSLKLKAQKKLNAYVEHIVKKYPKNYVEKIKEGLQDDEKFQSLMEEIEHDSASHEKETQEEYLERFRRGLKIDED